MTVFIIMYMQIHCISDTFGGRGASEEKKNHHLFLGRERKSKTETQGFKYKPHIGRMSFQWDV